MSTFINRTVDNVHSFSTQKQNVGVAVNFNSAVAGPAWTGQADMYRYKYR